MFTLLNFLHQNSLFWLCLSWKFLELINTPLFGKFHAFGAFITKIRYASLFYQLSLLTFFKIYFHHLAIFVTLIRHSSISWWAWVFIQSQKWSSRYSMLNIHLIPSTEETQWQTQKVSVNSTHKSLLTYYMWWASVTKWAWVAKVVKQLL